jgi:hypothetical protein
MQWSNFVPMIIAIKATGPNNINLVGVTAGAAVLSSLSATISPAGQIGVRYHQLKSIVANSKKCNKYRFSIAAIQMPNSERNPQMASTCFP